MLLALDIGNTNVTAGIFKGIDLQAVHRYELDNPAEDTLQSLSDSDIEYTIISSVVPFQTEKYGIACIDIFKHDPFIVRHNNIPGLKLNVDLPASVGADRICNIVAGTSLYDPPMIIVDFGTGTTYDVIEGSGVFIGGAIAPGIDVSAKHLYEKAALLRDTAFQFPDKAVGRTTESNLQSGIMYGALDAVEGMIKRIKTERDHDDWTIVFTGGFSQILSPSISFEHELNPDLTLKGMELIYRNILRS